MSPFLDGSSNESKLAALGLGSAWLQFGAALVISFLRYALLFASLPREDLGLGILMLTAVQFLFILDSAVGPCITTEVGRAWTDHLPAGVVSSCRAVYRQAFFLFLAACLVVLLLVLFIARDYANYSILVALWAMFAVRACLGFLAAGKFHVLTGTGWYYAGRAGQIAADIGNLAVLFILLRSGFGVLAIGAAAVAEGLVHWTVASRLFRKRVQTVIEQPPDTETVQRIKAGSVALLGNALGVFLIYQTDNFFIARYVGLEAVADYSIAYKLALLIPSFCNPFYNIIYPRYVKALKESDPAGTREFFGLVRLNHIFASLGGVAILLFGNRAIDLWVGPGHFIGLGVGAFMVAAFVLDNVHYPHGFTFLSKNNPRILMYIALAAGVVNLAFTAALAPRYGVIGVAAGTFMAQLTCTNVLLPVLSLRALNYKFVDYLARTILPVAAFWALAVAYWLLRYA